MGEIQWVWRKHREVSISLWEKPNRNANDLKLLTEILEFKIHSEKLKVSQKVHITEYIKKRVSQWKYNPFDNMQLGKTME